MMHCVQCDNELVAPIRSEYWSEKHACHIWHCANCCACFSSLVSFSADTDTEHRWLLLRFRQQPRQLRDIRRDPPRLVFAEQLGR